MCKLFRNIHNIILSKRIALFSAGIGLIYEYGIYYLHALNFLDTYIIYVKVYRGQHEEDNLHCFVAKAVSANA